jgi:hypothetical protein
MFVATYKTRGPGTWIAISGVDIALHDLTGKALGLPVSQLPGGKYRAPEKEGAMSRAGGARPARAPRLRASWARRRRAMRPAARGMQPRCRNPRRPGVEADRWRRAQSGRRREEATRMVHSDRPPPSMVAGLFDDGAAAEGAVNQLVRRGVPPALISVVAPPSLFQPVAATSRNHGPHPPAERGDERERASERVARRTGVAAASSQETGPVYAAGPVQEHLTPPLRGTAETPEIDLPDELRARGLTDADAVRCAGAVRDGRVLVLVDVEAAGAGPAVAALRSAGAEVVVGPRGRATGRGRS